MSRTLFWYVFKDLLKIFFMASGALAGIMSFGGLLRLLTENGLDGSQVFALLRYLNIAMSTYSLPVAALFATTVVYGRMSADNEITACRACGMSFLSLTTPAMLLGLVVGAGSLLLVCFVVPYATLKAEQVVVSNLARLITHQIEQTHETGFGPITIFAQSAELNEPDPNKPNDQTVVLHGPMFVQSMVPPDAPDKYFRVPREFCMARTATAYFHENPDFSSTVMVDLNGGMLFPRRFVGPRNDQGGLGEAQFGPLAIPSRLTQKSKFMSIVQLKSLEKAPENGQEVQRVTAQFIQEDQSRAFAQKLTEVLNGPSGQCVIHFGSDAYTIVRGETPVVLENNVIRLSATQGSHRIIYRQENGGQIRLTAEASLASIAVSADTANDQVNLSIELKDALVDAGDMPSPKASFTRDLTVPMPTELTSMKSRTSWDYLSPGWRSENDRQRLLFAWEDLVNHIRSEMHARAAFVVSCLLLVLIGAALGMMFRSGNFLTAFAVSVIPALLSIVLIVTGQHTAENTPKFIRPDNNPLDIGIAIIWSGNLIIAMGAISLLGRLQRK